MEFPYALGGYVHMVHSTECIDLIKKIYLAWNI